MYSMCQSEFERMAREAKVTYKIDKLVLVNTELLKSIWKLSELLNNVMILTDMEKVIVHNNT